MRRELVFIALAFAAKPARGADTVWLNSSAAPQTPPPGYAILYRDAADGHVKVKNSAGGVFDIESDRASVDAQYWTAANDAGLTQEKNLGALAAGLVINTAGTPSAYAGSSCGANNWSTAESASGALTCSQPAFSNISGSVTDAQVPDGITITLAATASALSGDGANCTGNNFAIGVDASGVGQCAQPAFSNLSGAATDAQIPDNITVSVAATASALASDPADCTGNNFAVGVNASGVAACSQPSFSNLSGAASDGQIAGAYSGTGACTNQVVTATSRNAAPTCATITSASTSGTFAPSAHATSHQSGGSDAVALDALSAPTDTTTLNASASAHGLSPKLSGQTSQFLRGDGAWSTPPSMAAPVLSASIVGLRGLGPALSNSLTYRAVSRQYCYKNLSGCGPAR